MAVGLELRHGAEPQHELHCGGIQLEGPAQALTWSGNSIAEPQPAMSLFL